MDTSEGMWGLSWFIIYIIAALSVGLIIMFLIICIYCYCSKCRKHKKDDIEDIDDYETVNDADLYPAFQATDDPNTVLTDQSPTATKDGKPSDMKNVEEQRKSSETQKNPVYRDSVPPMVLAAGSSGPVKETEVSGEDDEGYVTPAQILSSENAESSQVHDQNSDKNNVDVQNETNEQLENHNNDDLDSVGTAESILGDDYDDNAQRGGDGEEISGSPHPSVDHKVDKDLDEANVEDEEDEGWPDPPSDSDDYLHQNMTGDILERRQEDKDYVMAY